MKSKGLVRVLTAIIAVFIIAGCSSTPKKMQQEVTGIKTRVDTLESRVEGVESKQADVEKTTAEQAQALEELKTSKTMEKSNISVKVRDGQPSSSVRGIQTALKNAGFYSGNIDGVKGKGTRKAIRDFQKANGLKADGVVGPKTRELLNKYESGSTAAVSAAAAPAAVAEEGADTK